MTTTAVATQSDWTRTLLVPLRTPAWRAYLYFLLVSVLAVISVAFVFFAGLASGLLMATLIGIPLLALVVMSGRASNRLYRSLARLLGTTIDAPPSFVRPVGRLHTVAAALTDAVGWRSLGFLALHAVLMTPIGYFVLIGNGSGLTGLRDRLAMLDGRLEIDSPSGGPTVVTIVVPPGTEQ